MCRTQAKRQLVLLLYHILESETSAHKKTKSAAVVNERTTMAISLSVYKQACKGSKWLGVFIWNTFSAREDSVG